ncbi:MAG: hypothetical protein AB7S70_04375 [Hyphomicrobium sp.]|uniref:hypothetical protein n=1 Tax=Hyphomicrobium sp. TaxID=82 RepID=UPI003D1360EA
MTGPEDAHLFVCRDPARIQVSKSVSYKRPLIIRKGVDLAGVRKLKRKALKPLPPLTGVEVLKLLNQR